MVSRRELLAGGMMSGFVSQDPFMLEAAKTIGDKLDRLETQLRVLADGAALPAGTVTKLREVMMTFLRANAKFPDFCEIGVGVFFDIYDWHVKNQQGLTLGRQPDGRYSMQFMFTRLLLRADADPTFVGYPYDIR
jgi:hypothetical protein